MNPSRSLFWKMVLIMLGIVLAVLVGMNFLLSWFFQNYLTEQNRLLLGEAAAQVERVIAANGIHHMARSLDVVEESANISVLILDGKNRPVYDSDRGFGDKIILQNAEFMRLGLIGEDSYDATFEDPNNPNLDILVEAFPVKGHPDLLAVLYVQIADVRGWLWEIMRMILMASGLVIALSLPIIYYLSAGLSDRLSTMAGSAIRMKEGDFSVRMAVGSRDEVGRLAETFNEMAAELGRVEENRQQLLANVAHELRTPLTSIGGFVMAILDGAVPAELTNEYLLRSYKETQRMKAIINDLLDLELLRAGQMPLAFEPFELDELVREVVEGLEGSAFEKNVSIRVEVAAPVPVNGNRLRIGQILYNLIDNAVKYTGLDSVIQVTLGSDQDSGAVTVSVADQGPGLGENGGASLFERFSRHHEEPIAGSGLGLSISQALAQAHGGQITARNREGGGAEFTLALPG